MQERISKIHDLIPIEPDPIKYGGVAHHNEHDILKYFSRAANPFEQIT